VLIERIGIEFGWIYLERAQQALIYAHHGSGIVELPTVIRCAKQGDELTLREELISVLHHLMSTADQVHVVFLQKSRHNVGAKGE